jgi:hypothetical protein
MPRDVLEAISCRIDNKEDGEEAIGMCDKIWLCVILSKSILEDGSCCHKIRSCFITIS